MLAYGWENAQLIGELVRLDIPSLLFVDSVRLEAEGQLTRALLFAEEILFADPAIPEALTTTGLWGLQSRDYRILETRNPAARYRSG